MVLIQVAWFVEELDACDRQSSGLDVFVDENIE